MLDIHIDNILFNDDHVLQLMSETVAVRRWMNVVLDDYDGQMIAGVKCGLKFLTFGLQLRKNPGINLNQETDPIGDRTRAGYMRGSDVTSRPQLYNLVTLITIFHVGSVRSHS